MISPLEYGGLFPMSMTLPGELVNTRTITHFRFSNAKIYLHNVGREVQMTKLAATTYSCPALLSIVRLPYTFQS